MTSRCAKAGLSRYLLEANRHIPFLNATIDEFEIEHLGAYLHATNQPKTRAPDLWLVQQVLEIGCDPNGPTGRWPYESSQRYTVNKDQENTDQESTGGVGTDE